MVFVFSSCKFEYRITVNDDNSCTLTQLMIFSKQEAANLINYVKELPMNIEGRKDYFIYKGIEIKSWPYIDINAPVDSFKFEIAQRFASLDTFLYVTNAHNNEERFTVMNSSNYFTDMYTVESNFTYIPKLNQEHPISHTGIYDADVDLIFHFNRPINYSNGNILDDKKTVLWKFKAGQGQFIKISFFEKNKFLDFVIQALALIILYNIIILVILKIKHK